MTAYVIVDIAIHDSQTYERYKTLVPATIARHQGRYLARGGRVETLEGAWSPQRVVVLEFPTIEHARAWSTSSEASEVHAMRRSSATTKMIVVEGL